MQAPNEVNATRSSGRTSPLGAGCYPIGRLAELTGVPVKTIRFYSDEGLLPPAARSEAGHRRYAETDLARLQLIRSLRDLGVDLSTIRRVIEGRADLEGILAAHITTLETAIRGLERQLAVLRAAASSPSEATVRRVHALSRLDAAERRQLLDQFWDRVVDQATDREFASTLRDLGTPALPEDPSGDQLDAWLELAELAADPDFQRSTRESARWFWERAGDRFDAAAWRAANAEAVALAGEALAADVSPDDPSALPAVERLVEAYAAVLDAPNGPEFGAWLAEELRRHADPRAARYWELVSRIRPPHAEDPRLPGIAAQRWLVEALLHHGAARQAGGLSGTSPASPCVAADPGPSQKCRRRVRPAAPSPDGEAPRSHRRRARSAG